MDGARAEALLECYDEGECHVLALVLHKATGWPLVAVLDWDNPYQTDADGEAIFPVVGHVWVEAPDGLPVDIRTLLGRPRETGLQIKARYHDIEAPSVCPVSAAEVLSWSCEEGPLFAVTPTMLEAATRVLERFGHVVEALGPAPAMQP